MKLIIEDLSRWGLEGYGVPRSGEVFVDKNLSLERQKRIAIHETLACFLYDTMSLEEVNAIEEALIQILNQLENTG